MEPVIRLCHCLFQRWAARGIWGGLHGRDLPRPLHDVFQIYSVAHGLGKVASHVSLVAAGRSPGVQSALEQLNRDLTEAMAQVSMLADGLLFAVLADLQVEEPGEGGRRWSPFWYRALGRAIELRVGAPHERLNTLLARDYDSLLESLSFVARELQTSSGPASLVASAGAVATEAVWLHGASALHIAHVPFSGILALGFSRLFTEA